MNILQIAKAKNEKLQNTPSVKLAACQTDGKTILSNSGVIVPANEFQKFENGYVWVSGMWASMVAKSEAITVNRISLK